MSSLSTTVRVSPAPVDERLVSLDVLRELALLDARWTLFVLGLARYPSWRDRLGKVAPAGRMALTNYMVQCAALDFLAAGYGLRLRVAPITDLVAAIVLFSLIATISAWWLARFRYGSLEWVWRAATYLQVPPIRRRRPPVTQTA